MFDSDIVFVLGIVVVVFAITAAVSAFSDSRSPRTAVIFGLIGVALVVVAVVSDPDRYTEGQLPEVFARVAARLLGR